MRLLPAILVIAVLAIFAVAYDATDQGALAAPMAPPPRQAPAPKSAVAPPGKPMPEELPLALGEDDGGKTLAVPIGRQIMVHLKGNPTTGYRWSLKGISSDAVKSLGPPEYISVKPEPPRVGVGGTYLYTFQTVKPGRAEITIIYSRPWETDRPPEKTFTLTVESQSGAEAARAEKLKADLATFVLTLHYRGDTDKPFYALQLHVAPEALKSTDPFSLSVQISEAEAGRIVGQLAEDGFLAQARDVPPGAAAPSKGSGYLLTVRTKSVGLSEDLGWNLAMLKRLDGLRAVLEGDAAKQMDVLVSRLQGLRKAWTEAAKPAEPPAPAPVPPNRAGR